MHLRLVERDNFNFAVRQQLLHFVPVAERVALGISHGDFVRVEDLAPEAIARPLSEIRAAVRLSHRLESPSAPGTLPNSALTPGAVRTTDKADVCMDRRTRQYRHWSRERDNRILAEYGLPAGPHPDFEVDHLIPLDLGGADEDANLWPEPRASIVPYAVSVEAKDKIEWSLASEVCAGIIGLEDAQREIAKDWTGAKRLLER